MLGDPGTAKSQLLKFVEKCSPIGVSARARCSACLCEQAGGCGAAPPGPQSPSFLLGVIGGTGGGEEGNPPGGCRFGAAGRALDWAGVLPGQ